MRNRAGDDAETQPCGGCRRITRPNNIPNEQARLRTSPRLPHRQRHVHFPDRSPRRFVFLLLLAESRACKGFPIRKTPRSSRMASMYHSTRSNAMECSAKRAVFDGLAPDGGLYVTDELGRTPIDSRTRRRPNLPRKRCRHPRHAARRLHRRGNRGLRRRSLRKDLRLERSYAARLLWGTIISSSCSGAPQAHSKTSLCRCCPSS